MPPTPPCARCGRDAQFDFDELWLCLDCYHVAGSTCAGVNRAGPAPVGEKGSAAGSSSGPVGASASTDPVC